MEILVKHKHFRKAESFQNTLRCPLAMAIREQTGSNDVVVRYECLSIDGKDYSIVGGYYWGAERYQSGMFKGYVMNDLVAYAKRNPLSLFFKIPTKKIKLVAHEG